MSNRNIASLAFKLAGIYVLVEAIPFVRSLIGSIEYAFDGNSPVSKEVLTWIIGSEAVVLLLMMSFALILWSRSRVMAQRAIDRSDTEREPILAIHALSFSIVGLCLIGTGLPELGGQLPRLLNVRSYWPEIWSFIIAPLLKLLCGVAFFFGSHGLARLWSRLRYSGLRRQMGLCVRCGYEMTGNTSGRCPECGERFIEPARTE